MRGQRGTEADGRENRTEAPAATAGGHTTTEGGDVPGEPASLGAAKGAAKPSCRAEGSPAERGVGLNEPGAGSGPWPLRLLARR